MNNLKDEAEQIFRATLNTLDLRQLVKNIITLKNDLLHIRHETIDLRDHGEIILIGFGKASLTIAAGIEETLPGRITRSLLVTNAAHSLKLRSEIIVAGHPLPDHNSLMAGDQILEMVRRASPDSLIIFIITGGGSALVESPISPDISLEDLKEMNRILVNCGATIREINIVRKHLSRIKGGRLGYLARKISNVRIFLSDVNPGDLRSIASNPLLPDDAALAEVFDIVEKYSLKKKLPRSILEMILNERIAEIPRGWIYENKSVDLLLADNHDAIRNAADIARERGFRVEADFSSSEGDYRQVSSELLNTLFDLKTRFPGETICLVSGGEVSCQVNGDGIGGRNQEFVLFTALELAKLDISSACVLSCGTDGVDGNSPATGAVADAQTIKQAVARGIDPEAFLNRNDSHSFFKLAGGLICTGPTGNNIRDLRLLIA